MDLRRSESASCLPRWYSVLAVCLTDLIDCSIARSREVFASMNRARIALIDSFSASELISLDDVCFKSEANVRSRKSTIGFMHSSALSNGLRLIQRTECHESNSIRSVNSVLNITTVAKEPSSNSRLTLYTFTDDTTRTLSSSVTIRMGLLSIIAGVTRAFGLSALPISEDTISYESYPDTVRLHPRRMRCTRFSKRTPVSSGLWARTISSKAT
mmetsp:Transcript_10683/g.17452  ORF Transcript_10683/g.17452 Transcript_10683/m.17452 type:complete len:214 (+) Transcript_10683:3879-4520(+)